MFHKADLSALVFFFLWAITDASGNAKVTVSFGVIEGNALENVDEFLGIPYAEKPERFAAPTLWKQPYTGGQLTAKAYTPQCIQGTSTFAPEFPGFPGYSEDCLHLNVFAPRNGAVSKARLAVMLWIHGGSLNTGSAMDPMYNGTALATNGKVVVVAINYRLNTFGFSVVRLSGGKSLGNNGFRDQRESMRWVRNNIDAFGGNSQSITIFGESAGGHSTTTHVLTLGSAGLFDRAIAESPDILQIESLTVALNHSDTLATDVGCRDASDLGCLKQVDAFKLSAEYSKLNSMRAVVDGDVYTDFPVALIEKEQFNRVPFIIGNNAEEGNLFIYPPLSPTTPATAKQLQCMYSSTFGEDAHKVANMYPPVDVPGIDNRQMLSELMSDLLFHCDNDQVARALANKGVAPWLYSFRHRPACPVIGFGAAHASEIAYVFQNFDEALAELNKTSCKPSPDDFALSARMVHYGPPLLGQAIQTRTGSAPPRKTVWS